MTSKSRFACRTWSPTRMATAAIRQSVNACTVSPPCRHRRCTDAACSKSPSPAVATNSHRLRGRRSCAACAIVSTSGEHLHHDDIRRVEDVLVLEQLSNSMVTPRCRSHGDARPTPRCRSVSSERGHPARAKIVEITLPATALHVQGFGASHRIADQATQCEVDRARFAGSPSLAGLSSARHDKPLTPIVRRVARWS